MKQSPTLDNEKKCELNNNKSGDGQGLDSRWNKTGLSSPSAMTAWKIHTRLKRPVNWTPHVKRWVSWLLYPPPHVSMDNVLDVYCSMEYQLFQAVLWSYELTSRPKHTDGDEKLFGESFFSIYFQHLESYGQARLYLVPPEQKWLQEPLQMAQECYNGEILWDGLVINWVISQKRTAINQVCSILLKLSSVHQVATETLSAVYSYYCPPDEDLQYGYLKLLW